VTIVDNDGLSGSFPAFHWPLEDDCVWTYQMRRRDTGGYWGCHVDTMIGRVVGRRTFSGREYAKLGWPRMSLAMDGPVAWVIPPGAPSAYPPPANDPILVGLFESYPRKMFDASQPEVPIASGFAESRDGTCPGLTISWSDSLRCDGLAAVATPIGVFRHALRVTYECFSEYCIAGSTYGQTGCGIRYYIADSIGIVALESGSGFFEGNEQVSSFGTVMANSRGR
jgi:hypothetical protein